MRYGIDLVPAAEPGKSADLVLRLNPEPIAPECAAPAVGIAAAPPLEWVGWEIATLWKQRATVEGPLFWHVYESGIATDPAAVSTYVIPYDQYAQELWAIVAYPIIRGQSDETLAISFDSGTLTANTYIWQTIDSEAGSQEGIDVHLNEPDNAPFDSSEDFTISCSIDGVPIGSILTVTRWTF